MNQDIAAPASPTAGGSDLSETGWFRELEDHLDCAGGLREDDEFSTVTVGLIRLALDALAAQQARIRQLEEALGHALSQLGSGWFGQTEATLRAALSSPNETPGESSSGRPKTSDEGDKL